MQVLETIGFDLGHGETAVARALVESIESPEMLEINNKKVQITALGWHPNLGYVVGEQALIQAGVTQLKIRRRCRPDRSACPEPDHGGSLRDRRQRPGAVP